MLRCLTKTGLGFKQKVCGGRAINVLASAESRDWTLDAHTMLLEIGVSSGPSVRLMLWGGLAMWKGWPSIALASFL